MSNDIGDRDERGWLNDCNRRFDGSNHIGWQSRDHRSRYGQGRAVVEQPVAGVASSHTVTGGFTTRQALVSHRTPSYFNFPPRIILVPQWIELEQSWQVDKALQWL